MTRETFKLVMAIGVLLNSALYLAACFVAGLVLGKPLVYDLAIAASGVTYLSYIAHFSSEEPGDHLHSIAIYLVFASVALGVLAGLSLLFW